MSPEVPGVTHARTVLDWMETCRRSQQFLDTNILGAEGSTKCHRLVLTSVSPLLQKILGEEEEDACIIIPDISNSDLELLTQFMYTGVACLQSDDVVKVLETLRIPVSQLSQVSSNSCHNHLQSKLTMILPTTSPETQIFAIDNAEALEQEDEKSEEIVKNELELVICEKADYDQQLELEQKKEPPTIQPPVPSFPSWKTNKSLKCASCDEVFRWRAEYRRHAELVHGQKITDPMIPCNICNKQIVAKRLNEHIKSVHGNERPYKCEYEDCDKKFAKPSELKNHIRTHTGERPFTCNVCNASFTYSHILTRHKKYHEGTKKFTCKERFHLIFNSEVLFFGGTLQPLLMD